MNTIIISKEAGISSYEALHRMELYKYSYDDLVEYARDANAKYWKSRDVNSLIFPCSLLHEKSMYGDTVNCITFLNIMELDKKLSTPDEELVIQHLRWPQTKTYSQLVRLYRTRIQAIEQKQDPLPIAASCLMFVSKVRRAQNNYR